MTLDDVVLEYGKSQLQVVMLQKQLQVVNAKVADLTKQLVDKKAKKKEDLEEK